MVSVCAVGGSVASLSATLTLTQVTEAFGFLHYRVFHIKPSSPMFLGTLIEHHGREMLDVFIGGYPGSLFHVPSAAIR